jgi:peptidoglycan/LPS O-acetylase OafA/YrhL
VSVAASSPAPAAESPARTPPRITALDGLRGAAVVLVAVGHAGDLLWPRSLVNEIPVLRGFFGGGAVVIFFVVGGFIVTLGLLREHAAGVLDPVRFYLRRLVRVGVQLVPLALAILVINRVDPTDTTPVDVTNQSLVHVLTHTWNIYTQSHLFEARGDLGHLWYLSVQQQAYLVLPLVVALLALRRRAFAAVLLGLVVVLIAWRYHVLDTEGWVVAATATSTRADGLVIGVLIAVGLPWLIRFKDRATVVTSVSAVALVGLIGVLQELPPFQFLREWGIAFTVAAAAMVAGIHLSPAPNPVGRALSTPALTYLGRASLAVFVWHVPVFALVARHTASWAWLPRTIVGVAVLAVVVWASHRWLDEPARRWLGAHLRPPAAAYRPTATSPDAPSLNRDPQTASTSA